MRRCCSRHCLTVHAVQHSVQVAVDQALVQTGVLLHLLKQRCCKLLLLRQLSILIGQLLLKH
jgi:hypothetical protein